MPKKPQAVEPNEKSPRTLGLMVRELVAGGMSLEDAVDDVYVKVRSNGLPEWWDAIGHWAIKEAERELLRHPEPAAGARGPRHTSNPHAPRKKSWRERYEANPELWLDMEFPIGATGIRKKIRELTQADVFAIRDFYIGMADTMRFRGEYWGRIGSVLDEEETLEDAFQDGRLTSAHVGFLGERGRIDAGPLHGLADPTEDEQEDEDAAA